MIMVSPELALGLLMQLSLIVAIGPQNAFVLREGARGGHVFLAVTLCVVSDCILIAAGVLGIAAAFSVSERLVSFAQFGSVVMLGHLSVEAFRSAACSSSSLDQESGQMPHSAARCAAQALMFTWLNPHVYLDTIVLLGGAGAVLPPEKRGAFLLGACVASALWFTALGYGSRWCGPALSRSHVWRIFELLVALTMAYAAWTVFAFKPGR